MPVPPGATVLQGADRRIVLAEQRGAPARHLPSLALMALAGLLLGSEPLLAWTEKLPGWPGTGLARRGATAWHAAMEGAGLTLPYTEVRAAARGAEAARF